MLETKLEHMLRKYWELTRVGMEIPHNLVEGAEAAETFEI